MSFLKDVFDDVVDIAATPVRVGAAVFDWVDEDTEATESVNEFVEKVKGPKP